MSPETSTGNVTVLEKTLALKSELQVEQAHSPHIEISLLEIDFAYMN